MGQGGLQWGPGPQQAWGALQWGPSLVFQRLEREAGTNIFNLARFSSGNLAIKIEPGLLAVLLVWTTWQG